MNNEEIYRIECLKIFNDHNQCVEEVGAYISRHYISDSFRKARRELTSNDRNRILYEITENKLGETMKKFNYRIFMKNNSGDFYSLTNDRSMIQMYQMVEKGKIIFGEIGNGHNVYINSNNIEMIEEIEAGKENE